MFGTNKTEDNNKVTYNVTVEAARATKNDKIVMIDIDVNGVKIKSCMIKELEVKSDGQKYKKGDICFVIQFPSEKVGDKYYNRCWFPVSNDLMQDSLKQTEAKLEAKK